MTNLEDMLQRELDDSQRIFEDLKKVYLDWGDKSGHGAMITALAKLLSSVVFVAAREAPKANGHERELYERIMEVIKKTCMQAYDEFKLMEDKR
jgi:hypothetical protein